MKRIGFFLTFIAVLLFSTACTNGQDNTKEKTPETSTSKNSQQASAASSPKQVSAQPGLGDTIKAFTEEYGENKGNTQLGRFKEDYILPIFINDRAVDLTIQFKATDQPTRTLEEAKKVAAKFIPKDAKVVQESVDKKSTATTKTIQYTSDTLAKLFPDFKPVGRFLVILTYSQGQENEIESINIALGDMP